MEPVSLVGIAILPEDIAARAKVAMDAAVAVVAGQTNYALSKISL